MRIGSWNCQGIGVPLTQSQLSNLCKVFKFDVLFLIETLNKCEVISNLASVLGFPNVINQPPQGHSGGLALLWKDSVRLSNLYQDDRHIDVHIFINNISFYLSCVYGHPCQSERHSLWTHFENLTQSRNDPWILIGDFNEILSNNEKIGGPQRDEWTFRGFRNMVSTCDLKDIRSIGDRFSWVGERHSHTVKCCLDRAFINSEGAFLFPFAELEFLEFTGSDHKPLFLSLEKTETRKMRPFRFDKRLLEVPHFKTYVKAGWNKAINGQRKQLPDQVRTCRQAMAKLKHKSNLNSRIRINQLQAALDKAMSSVNRTERRTISHIQRELTVAYRDEERYWQQKSRNQWMKEGDCNTEFFHACTKTRFSVNRLLTIKDEEGMIYRGDKEIGVHAQEFFTKVYESNGRPVSIIDFAGFKPIVTKQINDDLTKDLSDLEIYNAICHIGDDKAPGPDGLTARFYKFCWEIVGPDVIKEVKIFFRTSYMKQSINHTNICMIPKITNPETFSDYRPIALCNVLYKIISKCLVERLKGHLDAIVSDSQAAFIPRRLVNDNVMIAHEMMHSLKTRKRVSQSYIAVKTDVSKAYDRVEWNFLETTMRLFGFSETWIKWIMGAVKSVNYSVLVNGIPHGTIEPQRGIRQGDPLSPYLFILCVDILSHLIKNRVAEGDIRGIRIGNGVPGVTHLQFADDSFFFCQSNVRNCQALKDVFDVYEYYSGQKINMSKSMITFGSRVHGTTQNRLKNILGIQSHGGGGKYLGLSEQFGRKKRDMFNYIIERVKKRTSSWSAKYLSPAGKEIMVKSLAMSMPVYAMSCFKLPLNIVSEIEALLMNFWWEKNAKKKGNTMDSLEEITILEKGRWFRV